MYIHGGYNYYGQFGINKGTGEDANPYPVKMQKVSNIIQMSTGEQHISMLDADGSVWSVGNNGDGQFGTKNDSGTSLPTQMLDTDGKKCIIWSKRNSIRKRPYSLNKRR